MATRPNLVKQLEQVAKLEDFQLGVDGLRQKYDAQGEHPYFDRDEWRRAVRDDETLSGYWDWVASALDDKLNDATFEINDSERAGAIAAVLEPKAIPSHCAYLEMYERHCDLSFSEGSVISLWQNGQINPISTHTFGPRPTPAVGDDQ